MMCTQRKVRNIICIAIFCFSFAVTGCRNSSKDALMQKPTVSDKNGELSTNEEIKDKIYHSGEYKQVQSYKEIYLILSEMLEQQQIKFTVDGEETIDGVLDTDEASDKSAENDFSKTNIQVEGIDEGDVIKTDGTYLYVRSSYFDSENNSNDSVQIIRVNGGQMEKVGEARLESGYSIMEFYVQDKILTVISSRMEENGCHTMVTAYDISSPAKPKKLGSVRQDGEFNTTRCVDGYLYLVTNKNNYNFDMFTEGKTNESKIKKLEDKYMNFIPSVNNHLLLLSDIYIPYEANSTEFCIISSIMLGKELRIKNSKAILSSNTNLYMTDSSIYISQESWSDSYESYMDYTKIFKFSYQDGTIESNSTTEIRGTIRDTFAINEYKGFLRIIATLENTNIDGEQETSNTLYIFDENLKQVSSVRNLAKGESVYSARFMGDTGYFVTFQEVDPVFSVDLSNPKDPRIIGDLKIPGFSEYLHFYSKHLMFGIGLNVGEDGDKSSGIKLSMFDISDPSNVKEVSKEVLPYEYSPALYNYKSVIVNPEKNLIAFSGEGYFEEQSEYKISQLVYSYDNKKGFTCENCIEMNDADYEESRLAYVNDTLYVVIFNQKVTAYSLSKREKIGEVSLQ